MTKGIKVGSYVLVKYFKPWRSGGQEEDIADYEGTIIEKRMSSQDRESHVVLNDVLKLLEGKIVGYEKTKRVYDVFIEDCREVKKRELPNEALAVAAAKATEDAKKPANTDMPGMVPVGMMSMPMMPMNPMGMMGMNPMGMMGMARGMGGIAGGSMCGNMTFGMGAVAGGMNCMPNRVVGNSMGCNVMAMGRAPGVLGGTGSMTGSMGGMTGDMVGMTNRMRCMGRAASMMGGMSGSMFNGMQGMHGCAADNRNTAPKPARVYGNPLRNSSMFSTQRHRPIGCTVSRSRSRSKKS